MYGKMHLVRWKQLLEAKMVKDKLNELDGESLFYKGLLVVLLVRLIISAWLPITGDEAYFVLWGKNLDYGYYDHTPFVGWLLAAFLTISDAVWWLRLPSTILPIVISYAIFTILKQQQIKVAAWTALAFLVAPVNVINILITTDTPLIFFSFISAWYFYRAITLLENDKNEYRLFIFSGLFLGFAFLSKYFAVLLGMTYFIYIVLFQRNQRAFTGLLIIIAMVLPFAMLNILWNYNNCWSNILFNLYNRTSGESDSLNNLFKYLAMLVYLFSPVLIYYLIKYYKNRDNEEKKQSNKIYIWLIFIPLILFLFVLIKKAIGLHWLLSFYPFAFIAASSILNKKQWQLTCYFMAGLSFLHILLVVALLTLPINLFTSDKVVIQDYAFGMYPDKFLEKLKPYEKEYTFSMVSYGMASVASYYSGKKFIIFSEGSVHARLDDKLSSYKDLDGKNILLVKRTTEYLEDYEKYFKKSQRKYIVVDGVRFELLLGNGFKYDVYRREILSKVNKLYYNIPGWLPVGQCGFKEKYNFN